MRRALASVVLAVVGVALLIFVASTAGPPDGYERFSGEQGVHVYLRDDMEIRERDQRDLVVNAAAGGDVVEVGSVPAQKRSLATYVRFTRAGFTRDGRVRSDKEIDVAGADEARELRVDYPDIGARAAYVVARRDDRFYTLVVLDSRGGGRSLNLGTVVDSFYLE